MIAVAFERIEKAWKTVGGGGDDERVEWPEPIYELEEILRCRSSASRRAPSSANGRRPSPN